VTDLYEAALSGGLEDIVQPLGLDEAVTRVGDVMQW